MSIYSIRFCIEESKTVTLYIIIAHAKGHFNSLLWIQPEVTRTVLLAVGHFVR